ncbi:MAG: methyltransferase domain-containing protein, partial [Chloroflexi bacterium]|nr:methyltransferase domain-containing protein [Chloroflexota bacterium]
MDKLMSNFAFMFMSFGFRFRDIFLPRKNILAEVGIKSGFNILDYGCGSGSYTIPAAQLVGESGKVYSLDINPLAVQQVQKVVAKKRLTNI